ncbi:MAG: hypothetical protein Q9M24_00520 [Mariprofundaceae bacterium]|nr:hypothetical protein [Mariprofundaceae bacterium]
MHDSRLLLQQAGNARRARHRVSSVVRLSRKQATSQCEVILVTGDNIRNVSVLESRIQSWGLNAIAVRDAASLVRLTVRFPAALACRPRHWEKMPDHPLQACIATHIPQNRVISYGPDLWDTGCPAILCNQFAETLDWAVHHG